MKRLLVCAVLVCALLLLPSLALGNNFIYLGPLQGGANNAGIEFNIKFRNQRPRKVRLLEFHNVNGGSCTYNSGGNLHPGWKINRKAKFHGSVQFGNSTASVTGKLKRPGNHYRKIVGTFRAHTPSNPACDTGVIPYVAKRGGTAG
jgi:hypothetical protein